MDIIYIVVKVKHSLMHPRHCYNVLRNSHSVLIALTWLFCSGSLTHSVKALDISLKIDTELALKVGRRTGRA